MCETPPDKSKKIWREQGPKKKRDWKAELH